MSEKEEKLLANFELKLRQLMVYCDSLRAENFRLTQEVTRKENDISSLNDEVERLKVKYDNLRIAGSFSGQNDEERLLAKKRLSKLVRDVEKCISILKT